MSRPFGSNRHEPPETQTMVPCTVGDFIHNNFAKPSKKLEQLICFCVCCFLQQFFKFCAATWAKRYFFFCKPVFANPIF